MKNKNIGIFGLTAAAAALLLAAAPPKAAAQGGLGELNQISPGDIGGMSERAPAAQKAQAITKACASSKVFKFGGAYFRKLVSPENGTIVGIRAEGTLPEITFDKSRYYTSTDGKDYQTGPLDRPSVYMGASSPSNELDCGLSWDRVYTSAGLAMMYSGAGERFLLARDMTALYSGDGAKVAAGVKDVKAKAKALALKPVLAFRPFWRTTGMGDPDWHNPAVGAADNLYFYPGEKIKMSVTYQRDDNFRLEISAKGRAFGKTFAQKGLARTRSFKRINSIDQFREVDGVRKGNEGRTVIPTETKATGASWDSTVILRSKGDPLPLAGANCMEHRGKDTAAHYKQIFKVSGWNGLGGEKLDIEP